MKKENNIKVDEIDSIEEFHPSSESIKGLNGLLFCISDIRHGIGPLLSIHLSHALRWDSAKIGIALATVEFSSFLSQIPAGLLADFSRQKRLIISVACSLIILGCCIFAFFSSFPSIILAQIILGVSISLITPTLGSMTLGLFGRKKFPSRLGKNEVWNHFGNVFTALFAGLLGYFFGSRSIFFMLIGFALGSLISLLFIRPKEINNAAARELPKEKMDEALPLSKLLTRSAIIIFNIALILYYVTNGAQMALVGQILANIDPVHSSLYIAACIMIAEITMLMVSYFMSRFVDRFNRKTFFLIAFIILPIRALLYTLTESPPLLLMIQVLDGVAAGILAIMATLINSDLAVNTGRFNFLQGLGAMSISMGESISQLFGGFIARSFGFDVSFFSLALVGVLGIFFFSFFMPETKPLRPQNI